MGEKRFRAVTSPIVTIVLLFTALGWTPLPVAEDANLFMPGSQQGSVNLESATRCDNCHGGYHDAVEPARNWRGSMMANAARDPLWLATLAVAAQDSIWALGNPNATDLCIRCHSPSGWLGGRSEPTNTSALVGSDFEGVTCDFCHRMVDPIHAANQPDVLADTDLTALQLASETRAQDFNFLSTLQLFSGTAFLERTQGYPTWYSGTLPSYIEGSAGQFFVDPSAEKRGPRSDAQPKHQWLYSRFHKSRTFCASCHDVSNPVLANLDAPGTSERQAGASYAHVERTYSEFSLSAYGQGSGAAPDPALGIPNAAKCQDCHMRDVAGVAANKRGTATRTDLALHDLTGGNAWMSAILASVDQGSPNYDPVNYAILSGAKYPGAQVDVSGVLGFGQALLDGSNRALQQVQMAATLVEDATKSDTSSLVLRVQNNTGHKLLSGYPEGRRVWLNVRFMDADGSLIGEINRYDPVVVTRDQNGDVSDVAGGYIVPETRHEELVWEAHMSSALTNEEKTFHFVLATERYKDNRIPPKGFRYQEAAARMVVPRWEGNADLGYFTPDEYAGGYDEVTIAKPPGTESWSAALYYQTTSREYIEFLRDEINGTASSLSSPSPSGETFAYIAQTDPWFANLKDWGNAIWELWAHNEGAPPILMAQIGVAPPCTAPSTPGGFSATGTKRSVTLQWNQVDRAGGYRIYYSQGGKYTHIDSTSDTSWVDRNVTPGQSFCYAVTAVSSCDDGSDVESPYTSESCGTATKR